MAAKSGLAKLKEQLTQAYSKVATTSGQVAAASTKAETKVAKAALNSAKSEVKSLTKSINQLSGNTASSKIVSTLKSTGTKAKSVLSAASKKTFSLGKVAAVGGVGVLAGATIFGSGSGSSGTKTEYIGGGTTPYVEDTNGEQDTTAFDDLQSQINDIVDYLNGLFTGEEYYYDPSTGQYYDSEGNVVSEEVANGTTGKKLLLIGGIIAAIIAGIVIYMKKRRKGKGRK